MFINNDKGIVFAHNPKTAGSYVHIVLKDWVGLRGAERSDPEPIIHHQPLKEILAQNPAAKSYYKFTCVRNPWERTLSMYCDFTQNRGNIYSGKIHTDKPLLSEFKDFTEFVINLESSGWVNDIHLSPQHTYTHIDGVQVIDYIMRHENFAADFQIVREKFNIQMSDRNANTKHRPSKHGKYTDHYNAETVKVISKIYEQDIKLLGYTYGG